MLSSALAVLANLATATVSTTPQPPANPFAYEVVTIAPNVYGFLEKHGVMNGLVSSNVVAVIGKEGVLVFDTGQHPLTTRRIINDIRHLTEKPIRYLVISHWHDDHWVATAEFTKAYPDVKIISHSFTDTLIQTRREKFSKEPCKALLREQVTPMRDQVASRKRPDGTDIPEVSMNRLKGFIAAFDAQMIECDAMEYTPVNTHVDDSRTIDLGGTTVELKFLGRGNTGGDLVAYLPQSRVILTGDLLVAPFPFATQSYITEWAKVLHTIDAMNVSTIVPGHGPVLQDRKYLRAFTDVLESIVKQARAAYTPGMTADQLREKIDLLSFAERFSKGERFLRVNFDAQMKGPAIDRMWQELTGNWKPEGIGS